MRNKSEAKKAKQLEKFMNWQLETMPELRRKLQLEMNRECKLLVKRLIYGR